MMRPEKRAAHRRWLYRLFAAVAALLLVSACAPRRAATPEPTAVPTEPAPPPATATPSPTPSGPVAGGTITMAFSDDPDSLDPALGSNLPAWQGLLNLYRGLMIYEGDEAVPDMAERYEVSQEATVYTYTLKSGITFHNGREVEAADFKYSLERVLDPSLASWASYYLLGIEGAQEVADGEAEECSGIEVVDRYTLRFTLVAPDVTFPNILALPSSWVVPREEVEKWGADFGKHPCGTGPFMLKELTPGDKAVFVRNPDFFHEGQPYVDETIMYLGVERSDALARLEKGELDVLYGGMSPAADLGRLLGDPEYKDWLYAEPSMYSWWLGLNHQKPPLDKLEVRQALSLAIDREQLAKLTIGQAAPMWSIYPAAAPGYREGYKPYVYDPVAAKAKLADAGLAGGVELELLIVDDPLQTALAQAIQQDLQEVGITVRIEPVPAATFRDTVGDGDGQIYLNSWYMVQPDPADLVNNLYVTGGGSNHDFYSNPEVDDLAAQALAEQDRARRLQTYQQIEKLLMDDAVHVPLISGISFYVHNPRIQGFDSCPEYGPFLERMWIAPG